MIRKLSAAICLACAALPVSIYALGLGEIHTKSNLNQSFDSNIDLLSVNADEIDGVKAALASAEAFSRSGVSRPYFLSKLKFEPKILSDGRAVIHVTSRDAVREPFLNFLVEVNWPNGRLVREYTVLLDPPVTIDRRPATVAAPVARQARQTQRSQSSSQVTKQVARTDRAGSSIRVQSGETLWAIARNTRASNVSVEQMAMAYFENNAAAFSNGNINLLNSGAILRVPTVDQATQLNRSAARQAFLQEANSTREKPQSINSASAPLVENNTDNSESNRLSIAAARPDGKGEAGTSENDSMVAEVKASQALILAQEESATLAAENEDLRNQVSDIKDQMEKLERLVELKNEQLARMQVANVIDEQGETVIDQAMSQQAETEADLTEQMLTENVDEPTVDTATTGNTEILATSEIEELLAEKPEVAIETGSAIPNTESATQNVPAETIPKPIPKPVANTKSSTSIMDWVMDNLPIVGGVLLALLGLIGWLLGRKRKAPEELETPDAESILLDGSEAHDSDILSEVLTDSVSNETAETSFLSDFSPSDIDALQDDTGEVDPMSEADVYIAYGRYQQAEDLIKQALEKEPDRIILKHKLLEIYFSTRDKGSFVSLAEQMQSDGIDKQDMSAWSRATSMGRELDPSHALFENAPEMSSELNTALIDDSLDGDTIPSLDDLSNLDMSSLTLGLDDEPTRLATDSEVGVAGGEDPADIGVELPDEDSSLTSLDADGDNEDSLIIDLPDDLSDLTEADSILDAIAEDEEESVVVSLDTTANVDQDSALAALSEELDMESEDSLASVLSEQTTIGDSIAATDDEPFSLDELDSLTLDEDSIIGALDLDETALSGNDFDPVNIDTDDEDSVMSTLLDDDYGEIDEIETKLDLAKSYIGMGDMDGAKSILSEVIEEGDDSQKDIANKLLADVT